MKFIGWNCQGADRGLHSSKKMDYLANLMSSTKAQVCFVSETRSSKYTSSQLNNRFNIVDSLVVPSRGLSGGLWLLWTDEMQVDVKYADHHVILANAVHIASSVNFVLVCIYGDPHHRLTKMIWDRITAFVHTNLGSPTVCMGDLNDILSPVDTTSSNIYKSHLSSVSTYVKNCGLFDIGYSGPAYTWTNKRFSSTPIFERLDRCLVNAEWCGVFPTTNVFNLPIMFSDHAPILLSTDSQFRKPKHTFKFENWWTFEEDYHTVAKTTWASSSNRPFHARTTNLAGSLRRWCRKKKPLSQQLTALQEEIGNIQMQPVQVQDHVLEANLIDEYENTMTKQTEYYRQRAKKHWATQGDRNTSFFHNAVLKRTRRNRIVSINDNQGNILYDPDDIAKVFVNYFQDIFSSTSPDNGRPYPSSSLPLDSQDYTYSVPDKQEILQILKSMKKNASPGPDGFNVAFYLSAWDWIGDDVMEVVCNFYRTGSLPPPLNNTHIALVPKKLVCHLPSDFRPISLCNVIYKVISKSLANRLKDHLPDYIHPSQQAFIQGRRISNNIIIAHEITHSFSLASYKGHDFMIKIDLAKAFDRLEWSFVASALERKGLHAHFINLIYACIASPTFSVIINGQVMLGSLVAEVFVKAVLCLPPFLSLRLMSFLLHSSKLFMKIDCQVFPSDITALRYIHSCMLMIC